MLSPPDYNQWMESMSNASAANGKSEGAFIRKARTAFVVFRNFQKCMNNCAKRHSSGCFQKAESVQNTHKTLNKLPYLFPAVPSHFLPNGPPHLPSTTLAPSRMCTRMPATRAVASSKSTKSSQLKQKEIPLLTNYRIAANLSAFARSCPTPT